MQAYQGLHGSRRVLYKAPYSSAGCFRPRPLATRDWSIVLRLISLNFLRCSVLEHEGAAVPEQQQQKDLTAAEPRGPETRESFIPLHAASSVVNLEQHTVDNQPLHAAVDPEQASGSSELGEGQQRTAVPYSFYLKHPSHPTPVQLPPPHASSDPPAVKPFFVKAAYRAPAFMRHYPGPEDNASYNYMSFLGSADPNGGKFLVPQQRVESFLESYFNTIHHLGRRMHLAECYNDYPYKYFQELDLPWDLDIDVVLSIIPRVIQIVTEETCRIHHHIGPLPTPIISMRTPYKVHLNYPDIITVEAVASSLVRRAVISRCRVELSGQPELKLLREEQQLQEQLKEAHHLLEQLSGVVHQLESAGYVMGTLVQQLMHEYKDEQGRLQQLQQQDQQDQQTAANSKGDTTPVAQDATTSVAAAAAVPGAADLDWESIIDFPHGSLRLLGSCKAPWMDSDPEWVEEKCYSQVEYVDGVWMRQPLKLATIQQCSILLTPIEQMMYEQSDDFLEASYQSVKMRQQLLSTKSILRRASKSLMILHSLTAALQDNHQEAVATLAAQGYQHYLLMDPEYKEQQQDGQMLKRQQKRINRRPKHAAKTGSAPDCSTEQHNQQRRKQQALEKLSRLQAHGVPAPAAGQQPHLIRPRTSQQPTNPLQ